MELGVVIDKTIDCEITKQNFMNYIRGYFICLDITDRTFQKGNIY